MDAVRCKRHSATHLGCVLGAGVQLKAFSVVSALRHSHTVSSWHTASPQYSCPYESTQLPERAQRKPIVVELAIGATLPYVMICTRCGSVVRYELRRI